MAVDHSYVDKTLDKYLTKHRVLREQPMHEKDGGPRKRICRICGKSIRGGEEYQEHVLKH